MYGGVAQVLHLLVPAVSVNIWVGVCLAITLALLLGGGYERIERFAIVKVGLFTLLTVCAAADPASPPGRRPAVAICIADSASRCRPPGSRRRLPSSASPASARPSS